MNMVAMKMAHMKPKVGQNAASCVWNVLMMTKKRDGYMTDR